MCHQDLACWSARESSVAGRNWPLPQGIVFIPGFAGSPFEHTVGGVSASSTRCVPSAPLSVTSAAAHPGPYEAGSSVRVLVATALMAAGVNSHGRVS